MTTKEMGCGEELAADAVVPAKLAELFSHVSKNMDAHARWVGAASHDARREHDALVRLAADYRGIAAAAERAVTTMKSMKDLPAVPHDPAKKDQREFLAWMRRKIALQRDFAKLVMEHADASEAAIRE